jgi:hypothetical protein
LDSSGTGDAATYDTVISYYVGSNATTSQAGLIKFKQYLENGDTIDLLTDAPTASGG